MTNDSFEGVVGHRVLWGGPGKQYLEEEGPMKKKKEMIRSRSRSSSREGPRRNHRKSAAAVDAEESRDHSAPRKSKDSSANKKEGSIRKLKKSEVVGAADKRGVGLKIKSSRKLLSSVDQDENTSAPPAPVVGKSKARSLIRKSRSRRSINAEGSDPGLQAVLDVAKAAEVEDVKLASGGGESLKSIMLIEAAGSSTTTASSSSIQGEIDPTDGKIITGDCVDHDRHAATTPVGTPDSGRMRKSSTMPPAAHLVLNVPGGSKTLPILLSPKSVISNKSSSSSSKISTYRLGAYESPYEKHRRPDGRLGSSLVNLKCHFLPVYSGQEEEDDDGDDDSEESITSQLSNATAEPSSKNKGAPPAPSTLEPKKEKKRSSSLNPPANKMGRKGSTTKTSSKIKKDAAKKKDITAKQDLARSAAAAAAVNTIMEAKRRRNEEIKQVQLRLSTALQTAEEVARSSKLDDVKRSELDEVKLECENYIASLFAHFAAVSSL